MKRALSLLLVFVLVLSSTLIFASCDKDKGDDGFDFTKEKMKNYISLDRADYIGIEVEAEIYPEITEEDVDSYIEYILKNSVEKTVYTDKPIEEGDTVAIYFRGELDGIIRLKGVQLRQQQAFISQRNLLKKYKIWVLKY